MSKQPLRLSQPVIRISDYVTQHGTLTLDLQFRRQSVDDVMTQKSDDDFGMAMQSSKI